MNKLLTLLLLTTIFAGCNFTERKGNNEDKRANTSKMENDFKLKANFNSFDTTVTFVFTDTKTINECQRKNFEGFISKQDTLIPDILKAILDFYKSSYSDYKIGWTYSGDISETELEKYLPIPSTAENLKPFITPTTVYIKNEKDCEDGTFNISFECTWDEEHGIGVIIKDWKVVNARLGVDIY